MSKLCALRSGDVPARATELADVVRALREANLDALEGVQPARELPSRRALQEVVAGLCAALFPWHFGAPELTEGGLSDYIRGTLGAALASLEQQVSIGLSLTCRHGSAPCHVCARRAREVCRELGAGLPAVRALLRSDVQAAFDGDPAAQSVDEALFCYPGISAMIHHRLAHALFALDVPLIPRIVAELAHAATGIDIHPGASIGASFFIDHGTGVVIGETCVIGQRVRLYQGVTLGAKTFPKDAEGRCIKGAPRHPIVEDDVVIYAGATVLGRITIGRGTTIGGNVWLTESVRPGARVSQGQTQRHSFDGGAGI